MSYLISQDYLMQIQPQLRAQINSLAMARAELTAQEEINGYLQKRYDTSAEFTDTALYNRNIIYRAASRVYINYPAYSASATYSVGNYATNGNSAYICNTEITIGEAFNASKWDVIGSATTIYFASFPYTPFNVYGNYLIGDKVFWNNRNYISKQETKGLSGFQELQYLNYSSVPLNNIFPDDSINGANYWTDNGAYSVPSNTLNSPIYDESATYAIGDTATYSDNNVYVCVVTITAGEPFDPTKWNMIWQIGDNRSQLMVTHMINIALYWAHYSVSPNNVPEDRRDAYGIAKEWCKSVRDGINSTPLPVIQPKRGQRILFDSQVKRGNAY